METVLVGKDDIMMVKQMLLDGLVVSFPTETVFGLAAKYDDIEAVDKLFDLKGREKSKAITLMVDSLAAAEAFCEISESERKVMKSLMPGKITIVLKKKTDVYIPYLEDTVGIRIPDDEFVLELLQMTGPLLVTSANRSGKSNAVSSAEVLEEFNNELPLIVKGHCQSKEASTVFRIDGDNVIILRAGQVTEQEIMEVLK